MKLNLKPFLNRIFNFVQIDFTRNIRREFTDTHNRARVLYLDGKQNNRRPLALQKELHKLQQLEAKLAKYNIQTPQVPASFETVFHMDDFTRSTRPCPYVRKLFNELYSEKT